MSTETIDAAIESLDPWVERRRRARAVRRMKKVGLPALKYWNYGPCEHHDTARVDCEYRACGGDFFDHQTVSITWLYLNGKGMIASVPGAGKTNITLGLLALLKERGELPGRTVIVVQTPVVLQWLAEARRFTPDLAVEAVYSGMKKRDRVNTYVKKFDVLIMGYHMLMQDMELLYTLKPGMVITDDVDPLLDHGNKTHMCIAELASSAQRVVVMNASNVQVRLQQLHAAMIPLGGRTVWGSLKAFEARYLRQERIVVVTKDGRRIRQMKNVGYKNMKEFRTLLAPWVLRHGYADMTDVRMPELMPPENVWLELHADQRAKYEELREGVLRLKTEQGDKLSKVAALAKITYGQMICAGLPALGEDDGPGASVKLDWLMERVSKDGVWADQKVVAFIKNPGLIAAAQARLDAAGIGYATVWGRDSDPQVRAAEQKRFWEDPNCRVFMGTSAMERGLNLHVASIVVNVDTVLNPERMRQILGRIRRAGSKHSHVWVFNLLCTDTQEDGYLNVLRRREAVVSYVWGETQEMYEALSPMELLQLIRP